MLISGKKNTNPQVTIICAWYNRAEFIDQTIQSLLNQEFTSFKIVVINDGSSDPKVKEILDSYNDSRLTVIHQENIGFTDTINKGVDLVDSPYVCIMGAGDVVKKSKLRKQFEYMENNKNVGALGTGHVLLSSDKTKRNRYIKPMNKVGFNMLKKRVPFTHGTVMYRLSVLLMVGKYDSFFECCQDWDLYFRILKVSEIHSIDESLYDKYIFEDGVSYSPEKKIRQRFFRFLAISQDRNLIDSYARGEIDYSAEVNYRHSKDFFISLKMMFSMLLDREWNLFFLWVRFILKKITCR